MPVTNEAPIMKGAIHVAGVAASFNADHLFVDDDGVILDSHIENMFEDLFYGRPLDAIFQNNFGQYYGMLTGFDDMPPPEIFDNVTKSQQWIGMRFGDLSVRQQCSQDPELGHCTHRAVFVEPARFEIPSVYAPSELNAGLLAVVTVFRQLAQKFNDGRFIPTPGEIH